MKYRCETSGCAKFGIDYAIPSFVVVDGLPRPTQYCSLCGNLAALVSNHYIPSEPEPEIQTMPQEVVESAARAISSDPLAVGIVLQLWEKAHHYSAVPDEGVGRIVLETVRQVLEREDFPDGN